MFKVAILPTSRNISAWSWQAESHIGWRLAVASRAKIKRPEPPPTPPERGCLMLARKASTSAEVAIVSGEFGVFVGLLSAMIEAPLLVRLCDLASFFQ